MAWLYLLLACLFEVGFTTAMRFIDNFKNILATAALLGCAFLSLFLFERAYRSIPLGTAYAIWTSIGAIGTVVIGMIWFGEPATLVRLVLIAVTIGCAIGLKLTSGI